VGDSHLCNQTRSGGSFVCPQGVQVGGCREDYEGSALTCVTRGRRLKTPRCASWLVVRAGAVPDVELYGLYGQLHQARLGKQAEDELQGVVFGDAGVDGLLAAEAGG
jgi:hypothetical protein